MRSQCIQAVSQALGRQITQAQAIKIEDRIRKAQRYLWQTDRQTMSGLSKAQQFTKAAEQAARHSSRICQQPLENSANHLKA